MAKPRIYDENMKCNTHHGIPNEGQNTDVCCWDQYESTQNGRVYDGYYCDTCTSDSSGVVLYCTDPQKESGRFLPPIGSILGHLPTTNAPPNDNTTGPSHGVITHNASTHTESSSSTGQAGQNSNHHNKGGNQGQVSGSIEGSSNKGSSNGDTNDKSKSNSKDNSGH